MRRRQGAADLACADDADLHFDFCFLIDLI